MANLRLKAARAEFLMPSYYSSYLTPEEADAKVRAEREATHRTASISQYVNRTAGQYFFTGGHMFVHADFVTARGFIPTTSAIPQTVVPRPGVEDGIVDTVAKLVLVFNRDQVAINPYELWPELQADEHVDV